jgi:cob(I)alamin adenosyltransferase
MKIYTKTGDAGTTGLIGGVRVAKDHGRICAYGSVDELNAVIGISRSHGLEPELDEMLLLVQEWLFQVGAELATPNPEAHDMRWISQEQIGQIEQWIDSLEASLPPLRQFILPGGTAAAAHLHLARTICRRAERDVVALGHIEEGADVGQPIVLLNRLSDLLFVMARRANHLADQPDVPWSGRKGRQADRRTGDSS